MVWWFKVFAFRPQTIMRQKRRQIFQIHFYGFLWPPEAYVNVSIRSFIQRITLKHKVDPVQKVDNHAVEIIKIEKWIIWFWG